jgi:DNA-binding response OmpR family regulator
MSVEPSPPKKSEHVRDDRGVVLVVDDEKPFCAVVCDILDTIGYASCAAYSAAEALAFIEKNEPILVLTDIMMPDVDGLALIQKLRSLEYTASIPIIVVSARATAEDRAAAMLSGADDFLVKPFSSRVLIDALRPYLNTD